MTQYSKYNIIYRLQKWMDSVPGQTFLNYAYSWGASVVIAGTLFKLTHLPGANLMLFLGMGTEVVVFFLSAFDRPFDKTTDGMELPTHLKPRDEEEDDDLFGEGEPVIEGVPEGQQVAAQGGVAGGGTIILGGGSVAGGTGEEGVPAGGGGIVIGGGGGGVIIGGGGGGVVSGGSSAEGEGVAVEGEGTPIAAAVGTPGGVTYGGPAWVAEQQKITPEMADATDKYVEELKKLTEMLEKVNEQQHEIDALHNAGDSIREIMSKTGYRGKSNIYRVLHMYNVELGYPTMVRTRPFEGNVILESIVILIYKGHVIAL